MDGSGPRSQRVTPATPPATMILPLLLAASPLAAPPAPQGLVDSSLRPLRTLAHPECAVWVESTGHADLLGKGLEHPLVKRALESPLAKQDANIDPEKALAAARAAIGSDPIALAMDLAGAGIAAGTVAGKGDRGWVLVLRGPDPERFEEALEGALDVIDGLGGLREPTRTITERLDGLVEEAWALAGRTVAAARLDGQTLVLAATWDLLIDSVTPTERAVVARIAGHAERHGEGRPPVLLWADLEALEAAGQLDDLRKAARDPGAHFVLGPAFTTLAKSREVSLTADLSAEHAGLELRATGGAPAAGAPGESGALASVVVGSGPRSFLTARMHRAVHTLLEARAELFAPRALPGIAEGLAGLGLITGGPEAAAELIEGLGPEFVVVAESPLDFEGQPRPDIALPGVCLIAPLAHPERDGARLAQAFQSLVALQNVERAMEGRPGLTLGLVNVDGHTMTRAVPPAVEGEGVDIDANLAPGFCTANGLAFLGTHHEVVARVVARTRRLAAPAPRTDLSDRLTLDTAELRRLLGVHGETLAMRAVLTEGKSREQADAEFATLDAVLAIVQRIDVMASVDPAGTVRIGLAADLDPQWTR